MSSADKLGIGLIILGLLLYAISHGVKPESKASGPTFISGLISMFTGLGFIVYPWIVSLQH